MDFTIDSLLGIGILAISHRQLRGFVGVLHWNYAERESFSALRLDGEGTAFGIDIGVSGVEIECHLRKCGGMYVEGEIGYCPSVGDDAICSRDRAVLAFCACWVNVVPVHFYTHAILTFGKILRQLEGGRLEGVACTCSSVGNALPKGVLPLAVGIAEKFVCCKLSVFVEIDIDVGVHPGSRTSLIVKTDFHDIARESRERTCRQIVVDKARAHRV